MSKLYQVLNDQFQPVIIFEDLPKAIQHIDDLQKTYTEEKFCIIELTVVHFSPAPQK